MFPHAPYSGATSTASLPLYSTISNAVRPHEISEEFTGPVEQVAKLFKEPIVPKNGTITIPDRPGLGLEIDEKEFQKMLDE